ncbi:MAG: hypothetical protein EA424_25110, partial [Planctomycetaceae bacterium]
LLLRHLRHAQIKRLGDRCLLRAVCEGVNGVWRSARLCWARSRSDSLGLKQYDSLGILGAGGDVEGLAYVWRAHSAIAAC